MQSFSQNVTTNKPTPKFCFCNRTTFSNTVLLYTINLITAALVVRNPCSDFMRMLWSLIHCRIIIIITTYKQTMALTAIFALEFCMGALMGILPWFLAGVETNSSHNKEWVYSTQEFCGNGNSFADITAGAVHLVLCLIAPYSTITHRYAKLAVFHGDYYALFDLLWLGWKLKETTIT